MANTVTYLQSPFNLSRKDKFLLVLNIPPALKKMTSSFFTNENAINLDALQFGVYGSVVPEIKVPSANLRYAGQTYAQTSYSRETYTPVTVSFNVDNRFANYWVIYTWLNLLNNDKTSTFDQKNVTQSPTLVKGASYDQYKANISIFALDEYNKRIMEFKYTGAFPTGLGGIDYSYRDATELESNFTFEYSQLIATPLEWAKNL
jgi:hypothetical protein